MTNKVKTLTKLLDINHCFLHETLKELSIHDKEANKIKEFIGFRYWIYNQNGIVQLSQYQEALIGEDRTSDDPLGILDLFDGSLLAKPSTGVSLTESNEDIDVKRLVRQARLKQVYGLFWDIEKYVTNKENYVILVEQWQKK